MFSAPMVLPPLAAWSAPAMSEFLWTPIWTPTIVLVVLFEVLLVVGYCGTLWYFGSPRPERRARLLRKKAARAVTSIWERPRRRAA